jgi:hypothetical protein
MPQGGAGEGRRDLQRIGLALGRAEGAADHALGDIGRCAPQVIGGQHLDAEPVGALESGLALDVAQLGLGDEDAAGERDLEVAAELGLQPGPDPDRLEHERNGRREVSRPAVAQAHEGFVRDLGVDAAGVAAGSLGIEVVALDQRDL